MSMFEFDDRWEVDNAAKKLNASLFGSKKKKKGCHVFLPEKQATSSSAVKHDSDDENFTKRGKKKLKVINRRLKKKQSETQNSDTESKRSSVEKPSKKPKTDKGSLKVSENQSGNLQSKRKRKREKEELLESEESKPKLKKRKVSDIKVGRVTTAAGEKQNEIMNKQVAGTHGKKKKKNNPTKNKYQHLALIAKVKREQANTELSSQYKGVQSVETNVHCMSDNREKTKVKKITAPHQMSSEFIKNKQKAKIPKAAKEKTKKGDDESVAGHQVFGKKNAMKRPAPDNNSEVVQPKKKSKRREKKEDGEQIIRFSTKSSKNKINDVTTSENNINSGKTPPKTSTDRLIKGIFNKGVLQSLLTQSACPEKSKKKTKNQHSKTKEEKSVENEALLKKKKKVSRTSHHKESNTEEKTAKDKPPLFSTTQRKAAEMVDQARETLNAARFRYLNEQLYTCTGQDALGMFKKDLEAFSVYHEGYKGQVAKWEVNPVNVIIKQIKDKPQALVIADFGCGEAKLAQSIPQRVHSFDLIALNKHVIACDMAKVPLPSESVDIAVFCLSLMGTNLSDYIREANRILKPGGLLKLAEVVSRFSGLSPFTSGVSSLGFLLLNKRNLNEMFYLMDFKKVKTVKKSSSRSSIKLKPCMYKRR